jgi:hypothetical protein
MKKYYILLILAISLMAGRNPVLSQTGNNVLLEFCTGAWCQWCPCGEYTAEGIVENFPNTMVLAYHGGGSDPYLNFNGNNILLLLPFGGYPTAFIGRRIGPLTYPGWNNPVVLQTLNGQPGVSISITKSYNSSTHQLSLTASCTSLRQIDTACNINFVVTEDHLWCNQVNNLVCIPGTYLEHNWVVRNMVNNATGESLSTGTWAVNTLKTKSWTTTLDASWVDVNCVANVFVYYVSGSLGTGSYVQQTKMQSVTAPLGVTKNGDIPETYSLSQNYPNPFNPTTNIKFSIPRDGNVSLKIFDITGSVVQNCIEGVAKAGTYNLEVDASNLSSGIYFYTLKAADFIQTKKMILVK